MQKWVERIVTKEDNELESRSKLGFDSEERK